jgi:hypothetical protein
MFVGVACGQAPSDDDDASAAATPTVAPIVDLRGDFPDPPSNGQQWLTPEWVIPAYSERQMCYVTRYTGDDTAIHSAYHYQSQYGHHVLFMSTTLEEDEYPDGASFDCTTGADNLMADLIPIYITILGQNTSYLELPEGMAVKLKKNTRVILQSHYLNTSEHDIRVQDAINLEYMTPSSVETWAAPFGFSPIGFVLPPRQETSISLKCIWEDPVNVLFMYGHMHEWGKSISVDYTDSEGTERIYEIPEWKSEYRDIPVVEDFQPTGKALSAGDIFTTNCTWFNSTDAEMRFPQEMCASSGMVYPALVPIICSDD